MNYKETVDYLYGILPAYQKQGKTAFKKDLTNIRKLCEALGNPHQDFRSIHVGGTNGKGTVSHLISAGLQRKFKKVGLYTSPHYIDFRERIKINSEYISEEEVVEFVEKIKPYIEKIQPSFFEVTVAMAFDYFSKNEVDFAVIEVGLGGRLDSTNIITPELSVITNIGMDHMNMLGNTIPEIAYEKAGIIKEKIPVIIGEYHSESASVFIEKAANTNSTLQFAEEIWDSESHENEIVHQNKETEQLISLDHMGPFHLQNTRTALSALIHILPDFKEEEIESDLSKFKELTAYQGRWQLFKNGPDVILDSGHNTHALEKSIDFLNTGSYDKIHMVLGFSKDKDVESIVKLLPQKAKFYLSKPNMTRGAAVSSFIDHFYSRELHFKTYINLNSAFLAAKRTAKNSDLIFIGGSSFVVGEMLQYFK